jgi:peptidoglycan hydrolase-like protein with peptidoglycan-binding domain
VATAKPIRRATLALAVVLLGTVPAHAHAAGSAEVAALQVALRGVGLYQQTIDGTAGPGTRAAVRRFQERHGLTADGIAGAATKSALGRRGRPGYGSRTIGRGDSGWDVAALQFRLAWHGFPSGSIDGGYGSHAEAAVRRFQSYVGLAADGTAGPETLRLLRGAIPRSPIWLRHPVDARIGDRFGPRGNRFHTGIDYPAPTGTLVASAGRGTVAFAGWDSGGYGNTVVIEHPLGVRSLYAHLSRIGVNKGTSVSAGDTVGRVGSTGVSSGPHLHFELRLRGAAIDPMTGLRG